MLEERYAELAFAVMHTLTRAEFTGARIRECLNCGEVWLKNAAGEPIWLDLSKASDLIRS
jgi:hypothetical protein